VTASTVDAPVGARASQGTSPVWWLVLKQELIELWRGGRALNFLVLFSLLMSLTTFLLGTNNELHLLPLEQGVVVALTSALTFGLFIGLAIGAESISGERERATLEPLLLTPSGNRQILLGKFLAAMSPWPAALVLTIPYVAVLSQGHAVLGSGLVWGAITGTLLAGIFVAFAMIVSVWSDSSRVSLFICLLVYAASLIPAQLPAEFLAAPAGVVLSLLDPVESSGQLLSKILESGQPPIQVWPFLASPVVALALALVGLFGYAAPRLHLTARQ
jgi:ABC-type transport system involved in multi-copper enzyme maturation permease subunit